MREQDFLNHFLKKGYFKKHTKVVLALSGGLDSMFLFKVLSTYNKELEIELILAHVNHKQRVESDWEEQELRKLAAESELPIYISNFSGEFSEARARHFRYDFFKEVMKKTGATALVTAHHADDQVETILMRLIRGTRLRYLSGIKEKQVVGEIEIIRPFLHFRKKDFPSIFHFEDASNKENHYFRNRIRNFYLPELEKENPRFRDAILSIGNEILDYDLAIAELSSNIDVEDLQQLFSYSEPTQKVLLQIYLNRHPLKNGYELVKEYQQFRICKISPQSDEKEDELVLHYQNQVFYQGCIFSFGIPLEGESIQQIPVSRETSIHIRHRKTGDFLIQNGHRKKLRRLFIDLKIPMEKRKSALIIEQFGEIVSILGIATSNLSKNTKNDIMNTVLYIEKIDR